MAPGHAFRVHAWLFGAGTALLLGINWLGGRPWWSFWPIFAWGIVFCVHYLVHKARTADESWADERVADLRSKSYDIGHIESIEQRYNDRGGNGEKR